VCVCCLHVMDESQVWEKASERWTDVHHKGVSRAGEGVGGETAMTYGCACATGKTFMHVVHGWDEGETGEAVSGLAKGGHRSAGVHVYTHV